MKTATNAIVRIIVLLLVFLLGFLSCAGAIVGVALYAYSNVSLDTFGVNTDSYIDRDGAEVILPSMTLENLVGEYIELSAQGDKISINFLVDRYGLIVPEEIDDTIPEVMKDMPIVTVFSKEGLSDILKNVYVGTLLGYESVEIADAKEGEDKYEWYDPETDLKISTLNNILSNYTLYDLIVDGINTQKLMESVSIGDVMDMSLHENVPVYLDGNRIPESELKMDVWYSNDGAPTKDVMSAFANVYINNIEDAIQEFTIMEMLGYVEYNDKIYSYDVINDGEERVELTLAEGLTAELSHLSLDAISNGGLDDEIQDLELYVALGYTKNDDGTFSNNGAQVEGFMGTIAEYKVGELDSKVGELTMGDVAGYTKVNVAEEGEEPVYKWYSVYDEENPTNNVEATGIVGSFVDLTINDMDDEEKLSSRVESVKVGTLLNFKREEDTGKYYTLNGDGTKNYKNGIMTVLAEEPLNNVQNKIDESMMGDIIGYKKGKKIVQTTVDADNDGEPDKDFEGNIIYTDKLDPITGQPIEVEWWVDEDGKPVHSLMNAVASYKFNELSDLSTNLTVADIIPSENRETGFIKLLRPTTKVDEIGKEVNRVFEETKIEEYIEMGVIKVNDGWENGFLGRHADKSFQELILIISNLPYHLSVD